MIDYRICRYILWHYILSLGTVHATDGNMLPMEICHQWKYVTVIMFIGEYLEACSRAGLSAAAAVEQGYLQQPPH